MKTFDIESYPNFFLIVFKDYKTGDFDIFEISSRKNDSKKLIPYLNNLRLRKIPLVGFNIVNYDYPLLHDTLLKSYPVTDPETIFSISDSIVKSKYSSIKQKDTLFKLIDLYKVWHYDNKNKATSLKWLEFAMRMESIEDLPYPVGSILTEDQMDIVIEYCKHDVNATEKFLNKSLKHLTLRKDYTKLENEYMMNYSEIAISKAVFGKALSKEMGITEWELRQMRTKRTEVIIKDIIFDYLKFNDPINQKSLDIFNSKVWRYDEDEEKALESISFTVPYKNVIREYAEGGLHSFGKPGIYESDDEWVLVDVDFASFYPHITFRNALHPEHIPEKLFNQIYEGFYTERKKYSKKDSRNYVLKIVLNGSYGLSKDKYAFLYDPKWQLQICVNGQLILTYLTEKVFDEIPDAQIIFENTDGAMYRIRRKDLDKLNKVCDEVGKYVNIPLETQICKKIIARDVNNYINVIDDNNIKFKGAFEIDRDYHKNHSKRIVPLALAEYYINNIKPEITIKNHLSYNSTSIVKEYDDKINEPIFYENHGIYDFCIGSKMKGSNRLYARKKHNQSFFDNMSVTEAENFIYEHDYVRIDPINNLYCDTSKKELIGVSLQTAVQRIAIKNKFFVDSPLSKTNRYIVTHKDQGVSLIKKLPPLDINSRDKLKKIENQMTIFDFIEDEFIVEEDRESELEAGFNSILLNKIDDVITKDITDNNYINYDYYIDECYKVINKINESF